MRIAVVVLALVLVGCKSGKEDKIISESMSQVKPGVYTLCEQDGSFSTKSTVFVADTYISEGMMYYAGANCSSGNELYDLKVTYSITSNGGYSYNLTTESAVFTSYDPDVSQDLRDDSFCNYSSWITTTPYSILDDDCGDFMFVKGDSFDATVGLVNGNLRVVSDGNKFTYNSLHLLNFESGGSLQNGLYTYTDGEYAMFLNLGTTTYQANMYEVRTGKAFTISGTFSVTGNTGTFTVNTSGCTSQYPTSSTFTLKLSQGVNSLGLREDGEGDLLLEKIAYSSSEFESAFLNRSFSVSCF